MHGISALLSNPTIYLEPYIAYIVPPVLTCCIGKHLGGSTTQSSSNSSETVNGTSVNGNGHNTTSVAHFQLRDLAASLLHYISTHYETSSSTLKPRIARTCLKNFLDPNKPLGTHYGSLLALISITGPDGVKMLVLPNLKVYDEVLKEASADDSRKVEAEFVTATILKGLEMLERSQGRGNAVNGAVNLGAMKDRLVEKVGEVVADRIVSSGRSGMAQVILETDVNL